MGNDYRAAFPGVTTRRTGFLWREVAYDLQQFGDAVRPERILMRVAVGHDAFCTARAARIDEVAA